MKINWKQKLSSRKFWMAFTGFVSALLLAFNVRSMTVEQVCAIISAVSVLVVYILAEGSVDAARASAGQSGTEKEPL